MEKDFLAGQGERKRISLMQFCSDSTSPATPGPSHPAPADGSARGQDPVAPVAPRELPVFWKCWRQVDTGLRERWGAWPPSPIDPWGRGLPWLKGTSRCGLKSPRFLVALESRGSQAATSIHRLSA